jgi:signal transduction histidine kinase
MVRAYDVCHQPVAVAGDSRPWHGEEREFLEGLINGMRCGILAVDRGGRLVMLNELGAQILGLGADPSPGMAIDEALEEHPQLAQVLMDSFSMTSLPNRAELDLRPGSDESKTIGFTVSMVPGMDDIPKGAAIFFKDLTSIEHKEEQERLRDRLAALGQMAASMAHEIRNPLASIDVTCSLLKRRLGADDQAGELLAKITAEVRRLNNTITSSLEFVRPLSLSLRHCELTPLLDEAIDVAIKRRGRPSVEIVRRFTEPMPAFLMDRDQMRQVFENLVLNALEAVGDTGSVTLESKIIPAPSVVSVPYEQAEGRGADPWPAFDRFALVRIADSGPGIAEKKRDKIFFPFYTTKKQGSGVGLAMAKKIVNSHRGLIDVDDAPEGGALISVRLPMALSTAEV